MSINGCTRNANHYVACKTPLSAYQGGNGLCTSLKCIAISTGATAVKLLAQGQGRTLDAGVTPKHLVVRTIVAVCFIVVGFISRSVWAQAPANVDFTALIQRLGARSYADREQAFNEIVAQKGAAKAALLEGVRDRDPEIRKRARQALMSVIQQELAAQAKAFESGQKDATLPGWARFMSRFGNDPNLRKAYAALFQAEPGLLMAYHSDDEAAADAVTARTRLYLQASQSQNPNRRKTPGAMNLLAMLFVATEPTVSADLSPIEQNQLRNWWHQPDFRNLFQGPHQGLAKQVQASYLRMGFASDQLRFSVYHDALQFRAVEVLPEAVKFLPVKPSGYAIECVARLGGKPYVEALIPRLEDDSVVTNFFINGKMEAIQSRDVAVAWIVHLTKQKPEDYDLPHVSQWFQQIAQNPQNGINITVYRFGKPENRAAMITKLKDWLAKNPVAPMPVPVPEDRDAPQPVVAAQPKQPEEEEVAPDDQPIGLNLAESFEVQKLNRARQLIREERYGEAAAHLGEIIRRAEDRWFQPQRGVAQYRELRAEAERLLRELPLAGLVAYENQYGPAAQKQLDEAFATNDLASLARLARESFHTEAGAEAAYRLACADFDSGRMMDAAMRFERLAQQSHHAGNMDPGLSLKRALCWSRLGEVEYARRVLAELKLRQTEVSVVVGGRARNLFEAPETTSDWLALLGPQSISAHDWLTYRGRSDRNPMANDVQPVMFATATHSIITRPPLKEFHTSARDWVKNNRLSRIPTGQPIVLGDVIVFRTLSDLRAINSRGDVLWTAPQEDTFNELLNSSIGAGISSQGTFVTEFLQERLFDDSTYGMIASDGKLVFAVESDRFEPSPDVQRLVIDQQGRVKLSTETQDGTNALSAYDIATGKLVWQRRSAGSKASLKYLGAPLVIGGNLFVVVNSKDETTLRELDAATGDVRRQWMLHSAQYGPTPPMWWGRVRPKTLESPFGSSPSYANGLVICRTPSNRIVAIDLTTGALRWAYQVAKIDTQPINPFNPWIRTNREVTRTFDLDRWCDTSLVVQNDVVLVAAPDSNDLVCLSMIDGAVRWTIPRGDGVFVAGVEAGRVLIAGRNGMRCVNVVDGTNSWTTDVRVWPHAAMPAGTGYFTNGVYFMPLTSGEVVGIEAASGRYATRSHKLEDWIPGNLVVASGAVYSLGWDGLRRLQSSHERIATLATAVREQPQNAALATELGEAYFAAGRLNEGLEQLRAAELLDASPQSKAHQLLKQALTDSSTIPPELRRLLMSDGFLKRIPDDNEGRMLRWRLQIELARAYERTGDYLSAANELLTALTVSIDSDRLTDSNQLQNQSISRAVRIDAWYQGQLTAWLERLNSEQQLVIKKRIAELIETKARHVMLLSALPEGRALRQGVADDLATKGQLIEAEFQWRQFSTGMAANNASGIERELLLKLPKVWQAKRSELLPRYAYWQGRLEGPDAEQLFSNGQRGREIAAAEPADSPVRKAMQEPSSWAVIKPTKAEKPLTPPPTGLDVRVMAPIYRHDMVDQRTWLAFDNAKRNWYGVDAAGNRLWELSGQKSFYASYSGPNIPQVKGIGPLVVVWTGSGVHALQVSGVEPKQLWTVNTVENSNDWRSQVQVRRIQRNQMVMGNRVPRPELGWNAFVLQPGYVALQRFRELQCLEPLTGKLLWKRDDAPTEADLVGDDRFIAAIEQDGQRVTLFRAIDGSDAGTRSLPPRERWVAWSGSLLIVREEIENGERLNALNVLSNEVVWSRTFPRGIKQHALNEYEIGVLDPAGHLELLQSQTGEKLLEATLPTVDKLEGLYLVEAFDKLLVFVDEPLAAAPQFGFVRTMQNQVNVNGRCHAIDRATGKSAWAFTVENDALSGLHLPGWPLLSFNRTVQKLVPLPNGQGQTVNYESRFRVLNVRTGEFELEDTSNNFRTLELVHDAAQKMARVRLPQNIREFSFAPEAK